MTASTLPWLWRFYRLSHSKGKIKTPHLPELRFAFPLDTEFVSPSWDMLFNSISSQGDQAQPSKRGQPAFESKDESPGIAARVFPQTPAEMGDLGNLVHCPRKGCYNLG